MAIINWCYIGYMPVECFTVAVHYTDVIMGPMASQTTSLTIVYSIVYPDADQRKLQSSASLAFVWGIHRDRWIPRTKGQLRGKWFHLMTSSWISPSDRHQISHSNGHLRPARVNQPHDKTSVKSVYCECRTSMMIKVQSIYHMQHKRNSKCLLVLVISVWKHSLADLCGVMAFSKPLMAIRQLDF